MLLCVRMAGRTRDDNRGFGVMFEDIIWLAQLEVFCDISSREDRRSTDDRRRAPHLSAIPFKKPHLVMAIISETPNGSSLVLGPFEKMSV
jgi:hypothetical protein